MTQGTNLVITRALLTDGNIIHRVKRRSSIVISIVELITKEFLSGCISGKGKDYFSCQKLPNVPVGGGGGFGGFGGCVSNGQGGWRSARAI
ncbi:MAG: hypothetical protein JO297_07630 [Nitrososphaeraceae archaeon]|nr:hypothetical protein [Nitrososphaeraceae archaeon]